MADAKQQFQKNLRSVLVIQKDGILEHDLRSAWRSFIGGDLNPKALGHATVEELLRSMPEVVEVRKTAQGQTIYVGIADKSTQHLKDMISRQKDSTKRSDIMAKSAIKNSQKVTTAPPPRQGGQSGSRVLPKDVVSDLLAILKDARGNYVDINSLPGQYRGKTRKNLNFQQYGYESMADLMLAQAFAEVTCFGRVYKVRAAKKFRDRWAKEDAERDEKLKGLLSHDASQSTASYEPSMSLPAKFRKNLLDLMAANPTGFQVFELQKKYKEMFGSDFDMRDHGCKSILELCHTFPDIFVVENIPGSHGEVGVFPANVDKDKIEVLKYGLGKPNLKIPELQRERVRQVLSQSEKGVPVSQFVKSYGAKTGVNLDVSTLGYRDVVDFLKALDDFVELTGGNDFSKMRARLRPRKGDDFEKNFAENFGKQLDLDVNAPGSQSKTAMSAGPKSSGANPPSVVMPGEEVMRQQELPDEAVIDQYIEVKIGEVFHPGKFFVQLNYMSRALDKLMIKLGEFYSNAERREKYRLPSSAILEGQFVAAIYHDAGEDIWHRGSITKIKDTNTVDVYYVDYGTISRVRIDKLCYLHKNFAELPAQAIRARLASVRPSGGSSWSKESGDRLLDLIAPSATTGHVAKIKGFQRIQQTTLSLQIYDTSTDEDINFGVTLVEEGFAEVDPDAVVNDSLQVDTNARFWDEVEYEQGPLRQPKADLDLVDEAVLIAEAKKRAKRPPPPPPPKKYPKAATVPPNAVRNEELLRQKRAEEEKKRLEGQSFFNMFGPQQMSAASAMMMRPAAPAPLPPPGHPLMYPPLLPTPMPPGAQLPAPYPILNPAVIPPQGPFVPSLRQPSLPPQPPASSTGHHFRPSTPSISKQPLNVSAAAFEPSSKSVTSGSTSSGACATPEASSKAKAPIEIEPGQVLLQAVTVPDNITIHLINLEDHAYILSLEMAKFFPRWQGKDHVAKFLAIRRMKNIVPRVIELGDCDELYDELLLNDALPDGDVPNKLNLYPLEDVPFMIKAFAKNPHSDPKPELIMAFNKLITSFDPGDPHWRSS